MCALACVSANCGGSGPEGNRIRQTHDSGGHPLDHVLDHTTVQCHTGSAATGNHFVLRKADSHQSGHVQRDIENSSRVSGVPF